MPACSLRRFILYTSLPESGDRFDTEKRDADAGLELELLLAQLDCLPHLEDAMRVVSWGTSEMAYFENVKQPIDSLLFVLFTAHET